MKSLAQSCDKPVPVILGGFVNAVGLARSFGINGIRSFVIDSKRNTAFFSRYTEGVLSPDPEVDEKAFLDFMIGFGKALNSKGFLLATNDKWLIPISKNQNLLEQYYIFPMSTWDVIGKCIDKIELTKLASALQIPMPKTVVVEKAKDICDKSQDLHFPFIMKPSITVGFAKRLGINKRTLVIDSQEVLQSISKRIADNCVTDTPVVLQEIIEGPVSSLYTFSAYSDKHGKVIAYSTGYKLRQNPPEAGTILSGRVIHEPELCKLGKRLIEGIGFHGISNTEYKRDAKDGSFKLIEINPRPGMWNGSVLASGINLPYLLYQEDALNQISLPISHSNSEFTWLMTIEDFLYSLFLFKTGGREAYAMSLRDWFISVRGRRVHALWSWKDPLPAIFNGSRFLASGLAKVLRK